MILINFDINAREDFRLGVPEWGYYAEKFNSDAVEFGGSGVLNEGRIPCEDVAWNGREQSIVLRIPPLAGPPRRRPPGPQQRNPRSKPLSRPPLQQRPRRPRVRRPLRLPPLPNKPM